jgi:hypothetical protein
MQGIFGAYEQLFEGFDLESDLKILLNRYTA